MYAEARAPILLDEENNWEKNRGMQKRLGLATQPQIAEETIFGEEMIGGWECSDVLPNAG